MRVPRSLLSFCHLISLLFLSFAVVIPLGYTFGVFGVTAGGGGWFAELTDPTVLRVTQFTVVQAALSLGFSVAIGLPLGLWARGSRRVEALLALPFGIPTLVVAAAWVGVFGAVGRLGVTVDWNYSARAVILAHVFLNAPWIALRVSQVRGAIPERSAEAARTLGAGSWARFRFVVWPEISGALLNASYQVFSLCVMSFSLVLILGGGPPVETLETAIYSRIRYGGLDLQGALACAAWQTALTLIPWFAARRLERKRPKNQSASLRPPAPWSVSLAARLVVAAIFVLPYALLVTAGAGRAGTLGGADGAEILDAFLVSFRLAASVALLCMMLAGAGVVSASRAGRLKFFLQTFWNLPGGISTLVLSLSVWLTYERWIDFFSGGFWAMTLVQTVVFVPVVFRIFSDTAAGIRARLLEAAVTLGASPARAFWLVEWPRWRGPAATAFGVVLIASMGEVAAISLFVNETVKPLPFLMTRWMSQYRFGEAEVVGAFLVVVAAALMSSVAWMQTRQRWAR